MPANPSSPPELRAGAQGWRGLELLLREDALFVTVRLIGRKAMQGPEVAGLRDRALKAHIFYCSNHPDAGQFANQFRGEPGDAVKTVSLPCSGKVDLPYLLKAFETGADGVVVLTCSQSECRHLEGPMRARKRVEAVDSLLEETGVGRGRIVLLEWQGDSGAKALGEIKAFFDQVRDLPQIPAPLESQPPPAKPEA